MSRATSAAPVTADSSVVIAAALPWHEHHDVANEHLPDDTVLVAHVALEAYSVLTRLPNPQRVVPAVAAGYLAERFPDAPLVLPPGRLRDLVGWLQDRNVVGGAVYDGLVARTAAHHGATLLTLDRRAAPTYDRCEVTYRVLV